MSEEKRTVGSKVDGDSPEDDIDSVDDSPPVVIREIAALLLFVASMDFLLYMEIGAFTLSLAFLLAPVIILGGAPVRTMDRRLLIASLLILCIVCRGLWQMNPAVAMVGVLAIALFSVVLSNASAKFLNAVIVSPITLCTGFVGLKLYSRRSRNTRFFSKFTIDGRTVLIPLVIIIVFVSLFFLGNTLLREHAGDLISRLGEILLKQSNFFELAPGRMFFWALFSYLAVVFLRPYIFRGIESFMDGYYDNVVAVKSDKRNATLHRRITLNTLIPVNILFLFYNLFDAYYLVGEGMLPPGMNHSQYAHQGALWLTVALGVSTLVLSFLFRIGHSENIDDRLVKFFAYIWWVQNLVLALWVYWRLAIYIDYNGLTRMRIIGIAGTTLVLIGFFLTAYKVKSDKSFRWLILKETTAFLVTVLAILVAPLDRIVWGVNTPIIMSQDAPFTAVQLSVQPISAEGMSSLLPLLDHPDENIARMAAARLGQWADTIDQRASNTSTPWRHWQGSIAWSYPKVKDSWPRILELIPDGVWRKEVDEGRRFTQKWI